MSEEAKTPLEQAWEKLTHKDSKINYIMAKLAGKRGQKVKLVENPEGDGGFAEVKGRLDEKHFYFVGLKVRAVDERSVDSVRTRFVAFEYIGSQLSPFKRAGGSTSKAIVTKAWQGVSCWVQFPDMQSVTTANVTKELLRCGGAHKPTYYDYGDGSREDLNFYSEHKGG